MSGPRVYLHIGSPKSGTTYVQSVLGANRTLLREHGVLVAGERHLDLVHAAMAVREDPRLERLEASRRSAWTRLVAQVRDWSGDAVVVSYELFCAASEEQAAAALRDLAGLETHVVITARDLGRAVPSAWQERLKFGLVKPLEEWTPPPADQPRSEWGWRTLDPAGVARRWGATLPPERVHVVTVPRRPAQPGELWARFAQACGIDEIPVEADVAMANESLGVAEAEVLRRVNEQVAGTISTHRDQSIWLRDLLANDVLASSPRRRVPLGLTDAQLAEAVAVSDAARAEIAERGLAVHGDLADLAATRPEGSRTPSELDAHDVADAAVAAVSGLLLHARSADAVGGPAEAVKERVSNAWSGLTRDRAGSKADLRRRIDRLEAEVAETRRLHLRVASLQDLVTQLLLPARERGGRINKSAVRRYRKESL